MIQPLRRAHRWIWIVLAIVLPVLFAAAMMVRHPAAPPNPQLNWEQYK